jgi:hypothetical protein
LPRLFGEQDFDPWFKSRKSLILFFLTDDGQKKGQNSACRFDWIKVVQGTLDRRAL